MSKTIKLNDETYTELEALREKRETFNEAVQRLLRVFRSLKSVSDTLGPSHYLKAETFRPVLMKSGQEEE